MYSCTAYATGKIPKRADYDRGGGPDIGSHRSGDRGARLTALPTVGNDDDILVDVSQHPVMVKRYLILRCKQVRRIQLFPSRHGRRRECSYLDEAPKGSTVE